LPFAPSFVLREHAGDPTYEDWGAQWGKLHSWILPTRFFRENLKLGEGGETGADDQIVEHTFLQQPVQERDLQLTLNFRVVDRSTAALHTRVAFHRLTFRLPCCNGAG
jgi:hypothetical protein